MPGLKGAERQDHDGCEAGLGVRSVLSIPHSNFGDQPVRSSEAYPTLTAGGRALLALIAQDLPQLTIDLDCILRGLID
jgi:hypothetical protein